MSDPDQPQWYCVHTKPKCEHLVAGALRNLENVEAYCPRLRFQRSTPRGKVWFTEALFPSYLFARFDHAVSSRAVKYTHNVIRVIEFGGLPIPVSPESIAELKKEMHGEETRAVSFGVHIGDVVEVAEGPMRGLKGIVESFLNGEERVRVLLEFLGRENRVEVPTTKLLSERGPREIMNTRG
ncbi:MAG: transcription termination/antitermination NusG family protein [Verrucomicrobiaceae bacterium]